MNQLNRRKYIKKITPEVMEYKLRNPSRYYRSHCLPGEIEKEREKATMKYYQKKYDRFNNDDFTKQIDVRGLAVIFQADRLIKN